MQNSKISFAAALALVGVFSAILWFPAPVGAFELPSQIVPQCESVGNVENVCSICHIFKLVDNILNFIFAIAAVGAIVMLIWGGFLMIMPWADPNRYTRARKILTNAFIGVLIIFFAWLAVDTIIKILAQQKISPAEIPKGVGVTVLGPWNEIDCDVFTVTSGGTPPPQPLPVVGGQKLSESDARSLLTENGISVNKSPCPAGVKFQDVSGGCTTLAGVKKGVLDDVISFKNACNCGSVLLTAGAELGHAAGLRSHATGDKVDIDDTPAILNYVTNTTNFSFIGIRADDGAKMYRRISSGAVYAVENDHIDIIGPL